MQKLITSEDFLSMAQCERRNYLNQNKPRESSISPEEILRQNEKNKILELSKQLYPDAQMVLGHTIEDRILRTEELLATGCKSLFNAHIREGNLVAVVDVLNYNNNWEMITVQVMGMRDVRDFLIKDTADAEFKYRLKGMAFCQKVVEQKFSNQKVIPYLMALNSSFVKNGPIDALALLEKANLEAKISPFIVEADEIILKLNKQTTEDPMSMVGSHCKNPICPFKDFCWKGLGEDSIHNIPRISPKKREEFIKNNWHKIQDIPEAALATELTDIQRGAVKNIKVNKVIKNPMKCLMFINRIIYPIYYLDFEAFQPAVPIFDNSKPFDMIPTQYSLHIEDKVGKDLVLTHKEFIQETLEDPRRTLAERLVNDLSDKGSIMVYNKTFESGVIEYLAQLYPDLAEPLRRLLSRIVDLMVPFKEQQYFHPEMGFSYSLKVVQPALVPHLSYKTLIVQDGAQAMLTIWEVFTTEDETRRKLLISALLKYCAVDTLVMVEIMKVLRLAR